MFCLVFSVFSERSWSTAYAYRIMTEPPLPDGEVLFLHLHTDAPNPARALLLRTYCKLACVPVEEVRHSYPSTQSLGELPVVVFGGRCYTWEATFRRLRTQWAPLPLDESELEPDEVGM